MYAYIVNMHCKGQIVSNKVEFAFIRVENKTYTQFAYYHLKCCHIEEDFSTSSVLLLFKKKTVRGS